jgi:DNA-nicking Smr family endonuclease
VCAKTRSAEGGFFVAWPQASTKHRAVSADEPQDPVPIPITGELDLHTFRPAEIGDLLGDYLGECRHRGLLRVRIVHGKGTGTLRATVQAWLKNSAIVAAVASGDENSGGWGATIVTLKPADSC